MELIDRLLTRGSDWNLAFESYGLYNLARKFAGVFDIRQDGILTEFVFIHAETNHISTLPFFGKVADPGTANIQHIFSVFETFAIVLCQGRDGGLALWIGNEFR